MFERQGQWNLVWMQFLTKVFHSKYKRKFSILQASDVQEKHGNRPDLDVYTS